MVICASPPFPSAFISEHGIIQHGRSIWSVGVSCPGSVPSQHLAHPKPLGLWQGVWLENLGAVGALLSSSQNVAVSPALFQPQVQSRALYRLLWAKLTIPSKPGTLQKKGC